MSNFTGTSSPPDGHDIVKDILGGKDIRIVISRLVPSAKVSSSRLLSVLRSMADWAMLVRAAGPVPRGHRMMLCLLTVVAFHVVWIGFFGRRAVI